MKALVRGQALRFGYLGIRLALNPATRQVGWTARVRSSAWAMARAARAEHGTWLVSAKAAAVRLGPAP